METSETVDKIAPAFVKAQAACNGAKKSSTNPHFKNKYADLTQVWAACEEALEANGLAVLQGLGEASGGMMHMSTMLLHSSGQWIKSSASIPLPKADPQGYGSATTYLRRYALAAMVGIVQEDDDGNAGSRGAVKAEKLPGISANQCAELRKLLASAGASEEAFCDHLKCGTLPELASKDFEYAKKLLTQRIEKESAK